MVQLFKNKIFYRNAILFVVIVSLFNKIILSIIIIVSTMNFSLLFTVDIVNYNNNELKQCQ